MNDCVKRDAAVEMNEAAQFWWLDGFREVCCYGEVAAALFPGLLVLYSPGKKRHGSNSGGWLTSVTTKLCCGSPPVLL